VEKQSVDVMRTIFSPNLMRNGARDQDLRCPAAVRELPDGAYHPAIASSASTRLIACDAFLSDMNNVTIVCKIAKTSIAAKTQVRPLAIMPLAVWRAAGSSFQYRETGRNSKIAMPYATIPTRGSILCLQLLLVFRRRQNRGQGAN